MLEDIEYRMDFHRLKWKTPDWKETDEYRGATITLEYYDDVHHKKCYFRGFWAEAEYEGETIARAVRAWKREDTNYIFYMGGLKGYPERKEVIRTGRVLIKNLVDDYQEKWNDIEAAVENA